VCCRVRIGSPVIGSTIMAGSGSVIGMGVNHGGQGDDSLRICKLSLPQILSCFKISCTRLLPLQCSKKLINSIILIEYSLFLKSTSSVSTKSPLQAENSNFFSGKDTDKNTTYNAPKHAISSEKIQYFPGDRA